MKRVTFVCTHPQQYSGYAKVSYEILKSLSLKDYELNVYAIQKADNVVADFRNDINENINIFDVGKNENGFNFSGLPMFVKLTRSDVVIIYNDAYVISMYLNELIKSDMIKKVKVVTYFDQVYEYTNPQYIENFNKYLSSIVVFSEYWKMQLEKQGINIPVHVMNHTVGNKITYVPKDDACEKMSMDKNKYYILNLNTNQVRKRYDIFLMGAAKFYVENDDYVEKVKLVLPVHEKQAFNFNEIIQNEFKNLGSQLKPEDVIVNYKAHEMSDEEVNLLYNACDIGINTCDGEGFGLCNIEHAYLGKPQIVSNVGYFKETNFYKLEPVSEYYVDNFRDGIGGKACIVSPDDVCKALEYFINNPKNMENVDFKFPKMDINVFEKTIFN